MTLTIVQLIRSYGKIATSPTSPKPSELAEGISHSLYFAAPVAPLFVAGLVLFLIGLFSKRESQK